MQSTLLGLILDSSVLIAAERRKLTPEQAIDTVVANGFGCTARPCAAKILQFDDLGN